MAVLSEEYFCGRFVSCIAVSDSTEARDFSLLCLLCVCCALSGFCDGPVTPSEGTYQLSVSNYV
jgi:hypothetical protein